MEFKATPIASSNAHDVWKAAKMLRRTIILLFVVFSMLQGAWATTLLVRPTDSFHSLNDVFEIRQDDSAQLRFADILDDELTQRSSFVLATPHLLNPGYSRAAYWLRLTLYNPSEVALQRWLVLNQPRLRDVSLFFILGGNPHEISTGSTLPVRNRLVKEEKHVLPIEVAAGQTQTYYIRIASETSIQIDAALWEPTSFRDTEKRLAERAFLLFGAMAMISCSGCFLFFVLRLRAYLYQALAALCYLIFESGIHGYTLSHLWPDFPAWDLRIVGAAAPLTSAFELLYLRAFLDSQRMMPRIDFLMRMVIIGEGLVSTVVLLGDYRLGMNVSQILILGTVLLAPTAGFIAWRRQINGAHIVVMAMSIWWGTVMLRVLESIGLLTNTPTIVDATPWAFLIATSLMLWAVTNQINQLQREKSLLDKRHRSTLEKQVQAQTVALQRSLNAANIANQAKGDFLLRITHDLRAPLTSILSYTTLLASDPSANTPNTLKAIDNGARYLLSLIDDLLAAARNDDVVLQLDLKSVEMQAFVDGICEYANTLARRRSNRLELKIGKLPLVASIDEKRLRQMLLNLLDNAAKFTKGGLITFEASCSAPDAPVGESVRLYFRINDNGIGIPAELHGKIFEPFQQLSDSKSHQGLGLGLAIVARWAKIMGGVISLTSAPGQGSRFSIEIDSVIASDVEAESHPESLHKSPSGLPCKQRVLIVDDDPVSLALISNLIEMAGFEAKTVATGAEAIAAATLDDFELVITDQFMPEASGWDVLLGISQMASNRVPPPVVLISSGPPSPPPNWSKGLKFAAVLNKPIEATDISQLIERIIKLQPMTRTQLDQRTASSFSPGKLPSSERLKQLWELTELGAVSDIINWADDATAADPETKHFADEVRLSAKLADISSIRSLILGRVHTNG